MEKSLFFRLTDEEFKQLEAYCKKKKRTKSDVLRELIRSLDSVA
ncbi:ribbon-helix-helix protein, CopG family [Phormidesmis sp. 146-35]